MTLLIPRPPSFFSSSNREQVSVQIFLTSFLGMSYLLYSKCKMAVYLFEISEWSSVDFLKVVPVNLL